MIGGPAGTGCEFGTFGTHTPAVVVAEVGAHHCVGWQSSSFVQAGPHAPLATSQLGPACAPVMQSASFVHLPHDPATVASPVAKHVGAFAS